MWRMPKALGRYLFGREGGKLVRRKWLLEDLFSGGGVLGGGGVIFILRGYFLLLLFLFLN